MDITNWNLDFGSWLFNGITMVSYAVMFAEAYYCVLKKEELTKLDGIELCIMFAAALSVLVFGISYGRRTLIVVSESVMLIIYYIMWFVGFLAGIKLIITFMIFIIKKIDNHFIHDD